jgi:hypothetical protein
MASAGIIGGWIIADGYLESYTLIDPNGGKVDGNLKNRFYIASDKDSAANYLYAASSDSQGNYTRKFAVTKQGVLYATGATISGTINANSGNIGGCTFSAGGVLQIKNANIESISSDKIKIGDTNSALFEYTDTTITMRTSPSGSGLSLDDESFMIWGTTNNFIKMDAWTDDPHDGPYYGDYGMIIFSGSNGGKLGGTWYLDSDTPVTSDENFKHSIQKLDSYNYDEFFNNLLPRRFKYNDGTSDRYHIGFIS